MPVKFQARHYEALADTLAELRPEKMPPRPTEPYNPEFDHWSYGEAEMWHAVTAALSTLFQADNPNFDPARFVQACTER